MAWKKVAASGVIERDFLFGGRLRLRLRFASQALFEAFLPALQDRLVESDSTQHPDGLFHLWDGATTGVVLEQPEAGAADLNPRTKLVAECEQVSWVAQRSTGAISLLEHASNRGLFYTPDAHDLPYHEKGGPLRDLLHLWLYPRHLHMMHGAAMGLQGNGVLVVGKSGSGKSTTALSCVLDGFEYVGDDYILLEGQQQPRAYNLYGTAKLEAGHLRRFPSLADKAFYESNLLEEKSLLMVRDIEAARVVESLQLKAIILPRVVGTGATTATPISPIAALRALAPSTIFQLQGGREAAFRAASSCVQHLPAYELALGAEIGDIPSTLRNLLGDLS